MAENLRVWPLHSPFPLGACPPPPTTHLPMLGTSWSIPVQQEMGSGMGALGGFDKSYESITKTSSGSLLTPSVPRGTNSCGTHPTVLFGVLWLSSD